MKNLVCGEGREQNEGVIVRKLDYVIAYDDMLEKGKLDRYDPPTITSTNCKNWISALDPKTCPECRSRHGQIYNIYESVDPMPPLHYGCRCEIKDMQAVLAGDATKDGRNGADWWLKYIGELPDYYISDKDAVAAGWYYGKSPVKYVPGKMITFGEYDNENGHLPEAEGRVWYEADINYYEGKRNKHRILWSNDGLIFVTYDHYETFYEIV